MDLPGEQKEAYRSLHALLERIATCPLGLADTDTFAQQERLKGRILCFLRFLWILGRFGEPTDDRLRVGPQSYLANRGSQTALGTRSYLEATLFPVFAEMGIHAELKPLGERWMTPGGALRYADWEIDVALEPRIGGTPVLEALRRYTRRLDEAYGPRAFRRFAKTDMHVLLE